MIINPNGCITQRIKLEFSMSHPFEPNEIGKITKIKSTVILRKEENIQWEKKPQIMGK